MSMKEMAHLKPIEKEIYKRWLSHRYLQGIREFDVHLDVPIVNKPAWWTKKDLAAWHAVRDKRIDLVVHTQREIWIIEITPKVSKAAVGGCLTYKELYEHQFKPKKPIRLGIVCELDDLAYHNTLNQFKIKLWVV